MRKASLRIHFVFVLLLTSCTAQGISQETATGISTQVYVNNSVSVETTREFLTPTNIFQVTPVSTLSVNKGTSTSAFIPVPISTTPISTPTMALQPTPTIQETTTFCVDRTGMDIVGTTSSVSNEITYLNPIVGIELTYSDDMSLFEDQFLFESYGFTLMSSVDSEALVLRSGWLYGLPSDQLESRIQGVIEAFPNVPIRRENLVVGQQPAIMLSPIPGVSPTTFIYVVANDRIYEFIFGQEVLDDESTAILSSIRFVEPGLSLNCLDLLPAEHVPEDVPQLETPYE